MTAAVKLLTVLLLAVAVSAQSPLEDCVKTFNKDTDCFKDKSTNDAAKLFTVEYKNYYKIVSLKPSFGSPSSYALVIRGAPKTDLPTNVNGTFEIPVNNVAIGDTTTIPFLEVLGKRGAIKAAVGPEYASSPCFQKLTDAGSIKKINEKAPNGEVVADVDVIFSGSGTVTGLGEGKWVSQAASSDPGAFNRAEHLEYFAQWFGLEGKAQETTTDIQKRYTAIKEAAKKSAPSTPLKVAWVSYSAPASFNNNTASWSFSGAAYKRDLVTDAGATLLQPSGAIFKDVNAFKQAIADADVAIWESFATGEDQNMEAFTKTFGLTSDFKVVKNGQVYGLDKRVNPTAFMDWFESALVFPNVVLTDIVSIVNPNAVKGATRTYLRKVDEKSTVLTKDQCTGDATAALTVQGLAASEITSVSNSTATAGKPNAAASNQAGVAAAAAALVGAVAVALA